MKAQQLKTFATDPAAFRQSLLIDADSGPQHFGDVADHWQRQDFAALDPAWLSMAGRGPAPKHRRAWYERPRGHSKTTDIAVQVLWGLAFAPHQVSGVVAAVDRQQARLLRNGIDKLVRMNSWLASVIDIQRSLIRNVRTASELEVISSDAPASYGRTPSFVVCDELCHWGSRDLWDSLVSASAKRRDCVLVVISNAGFSESWQWDVRETIRLDAGWYFNALDGPKASWITQDRLDQQRRLLPDPVFRRLWLNEWSSGSGDALQADDIDAAITQTGPMSPARGWRFVAGLDLGVSRDHSALAVVGRHGGYREERPPEQKPRSNLSAALLDLGFVQPPNDNDSDPEYIQHPATHRLRLANIASWKPPRKGKIDLQAVENAVLSAYQRYALDGVCYDPHQAAFMAQRLRRAGVRMIEVPFTGNNLQDMASELLEQFNSRNIDLYPEQTLLQELRTLRIVERAYGFRLEAPRSAEGHGDRATAFALAVLGARRYIRVSTILNRPLLHEGIRIHDCYPVSDDRPMCTPNWTEPTGPLGVRL